MTQEELQQQLRAMLQDLTAVLKARHIEYFLIGGSAIGAVREHDLIPWDDDIDLGIKREYIADFVTAVKDSHLLETYQLISPGETAHYYFPTYKLFLALDDAPVDIGTGYRGVFIDIFALDKAAATKWRRRFQQLAVRLDQIALDIAKGDQMAGQKLGPLRCIVTRRAKTQTKEALFARYLRDIQRQSHLKRGFLYYNFGSPYPWDREFYLVSEVAAASPQFFDGQPQPVPVGYHAILTRMYGNYMAPPKEVERQPKHLNQ